MEPLVILLGVLGVIFFLFFFGLLGDKQGGLVRSVAWAFAVIMLLFIPWLASSQTCEVVKANQTVAGNVTSFAYTNYCYDNPSGIGTTLFKIMTWLFRIFAVYLTIAFFVQLADYIRAYKVGKR